MDWQIQGTPLPMRSQDCCGCVCGRNRPAGGVVKTLLTEARKRGAWVGRDDGGVGRHQLGPGICIGW
jgi:hypothetical protein